MTQPSFPEKTVRRTPPVQQSPRKSIEQLGIYEHLPPILRLISEKPVTGVLAPTGYGKSIGVPWILAKQGAKVFVSVPTRASAMSLSETLKSLDNSVNVGYAAEGNVKYDEDTQIVYATSGHMRKKLLRHFDQGICIKIDFATVLILDEIHNQTVDDNVIEALWKTCALTKVQVPRLVLSSADLDRDKHPEASVYEIDAETYPIQIMYHDKDYDVDDSRILSDVATKVTEYHGTNVTGHFLVFVSGSTEVETVRSLLTTLTNADVLPAYSNLSAEQIHKIFESVAPGIRKIIIATNVAETSITIENVGMVFDTLREKRPETSMTGGLRLSSHFVSKASASQRTGRTGRTGPGISYRMMTEREFKKLEAHRPPELTRVPIYETIMELLDVGLNPVTILPHLTIQKMDSAVDLLKRLGMVDNNNHVTDIGHFAPKFPLSVRNASILWNWIQKGLPIFPAIVTLALIDSYGPSYMWFPLKEDGQTHTDYNIAIDTHRETYFNKFMGRSDVHTFLNIWHDLMASVGGMTGAKSKIKVLDWSRRNSMNNRKIREVINIVEQSVNTARRLQHDVEIGPFTTDGVINALRPFAEQAYEDLVMDLNQSASGRITYRHQPSRSSYLLEGRRAVNELTMNPPQRLIGLITIEIPTKQGNLHIISVALDLEGRAQATRPGRPAPRDTRTKIRTRHPSKPRPQIRGIPPTLKPPELKPPVLGPKITAGPATAPPAIGGLPPLVPTGKGTPIFREETRVATFPVGEEEFQLAEQTAMAGRPVTVVEQPTAGPIVQLPVRFQEPTMFTPQPAVQRETTHIPMVIPPPMVRLSQVMPPQKRVFLGLDNLNANVLKEVLAPDGWDFINEKDVLQKRYVDLLILEGKYGWDKRFYNVKSWMKSRLDAFAITNKANMHLIMTERAPQYIADTFIVPSDSKVSPQKPPGIWIWRPEEQYAGKGVEVIDTQDTMDKVWKKHLSTPKHQRALVSKYIEDPMLIDGKKFHLRLYFLVVATPTSKRSALYRQGEFVTAKLPYVNGDYQNKDIHDTHFKDDPGYRFPQDYPASEHEKDRIIREVHAGLTALSSAALPLIKTYPESTAGFEVLAVDYMLDANGELYLIEINVKPGFDIEDQERVDWLTKFLFEGVNEFAIKTPTDPNQLTQVIPCADIDPTTVKTAFLGIDDLNVDVVKDVFRPDGWTFFTENEAMISGYADMVILEGKYGFDGRFYTYECGIKSRVDATQITNKAELHAMMAQYAPQYIAQTYIVPPNMAGPPQKPEGVWIWRPEETFGGQGVEVIETQEDLTRAWHTRQENPTKSKGKRTLLSEYIEDPLLIDGKKFHLRLYFLIVATPTSKRSALYRQGEFVTAKLPYVKGDYRNKDIHDTHFKDDIGGRFPQDYPFGEAAAAKVLSDSHAALTILSQAALAMIKPYPECESGFEILGVDFMLDASNRLYLLETNTTPGFLRFGNQERIDWLSKFIYEGVNEFAVKTPTDPNQLTQVIQCLDLPA